MSKTIYCEYTRPFYIGPKYLVYKGEMLNGKRHGKGIEYAYYGNVFV